MIVWQIMKHFHSRTLGTFRNLMKGKRETPLFSCDLTEEVSICPCAFSHITAGINPLFLLLPFLRPSPSFSSSGHPSRSAACLSGGWQNTALSSLTMFNLGMTHLPRLHKYFLW